jgi:hypothetical protein
MKALGAIGTLPHLRFGHIRRAEKQSEPADRVKLRAKRSHQGMEWWATREADPMIAAMAMLRMLGH